jgi:hypothetical protein
MKVIIGTSLSILAAFGIIIAVRSQGMSSSFHVSHVLTIQLLPFKAPPPPRTLTREYQEASNEQLRNQNANPIVSFALQHSMHRRLQSVRSLIGRLQRQGNGPVVIWTLDVVCVVLWMWIMENNTHCQYLRTITMDLSDDMAFIVDWIRQRESWPSNQSN